MKFFALQKIEKPYFGVEDIANALGIALSSAKTTANRYTKQGILLRIKNNMYVLKAAWIAAGREDKFLLANYCQVPSYLSLMTALDYFEITTQVQKNFFESIAIKRSKEIAVDGTVFRYVKLAPNLYGGFKKEKNFFIAAPEKALLDAFYLMSCGRYGFDLASLDPAKLDRGEIERLVENFPLKTKALVKRYGYI